MRAKFTLLCLMAFLVCVIVLVETQTAVSQFGGKGGKGGGKGGKGGFDPGKMFDWMDKDKKGYISIADMRFGKDEAELFAKENGITNGQLTRDQFMKYSEQGEALRQKTGNTGGFGGKGKGKGKGKGGPGEAPKGPKVTVGDENDVDRIAEEQFRKFDTNGDGNLNEEELLKTKRLKDEWQKWDENKDKLISLSEYRAYFRDFTKRLNEKIEAKRANNEENKNDSKPGGIKRIIIEEDEEVLPSTFHVGSVLPKGIPDWFTELDTDPKDGQVSLYEWARLGKKDVELFEKMDRNGDGLLTAEEVLHYQRQAAVPQRQVSQVAIISGTRIDEPPTRPNAPFGGKGKGKGKGKGGPGKKGKIGG